VGVEQHLKFDAAACLKQRKAVHGYAVLFGAIGFCWELVGYDGYVDFALGKQFGVLIGCVFGAASMRIEKFA
jgi:hypothetical protein